MSTGDDGAIVAVLGSILDRWQRLDRGWKAVVLGLAVLSIVVAV